MVMKRWITTRPAHDCIRVQPCKFGSDRCVPGGGGNHGVHSVDMVWYVAGETNRGTAFVQFLLFTGWLRDETYKHYEGQPSQRGYGGVYYNPLTPMAADLGFHSPYSMYEGQEPMSNCSLIDGDCFYDGSSLNAEEPWRILRHDGDEALWTYLETYWASQFIDAVVV